MIGVYQAAHLILFLYRDPIVTSARGMRSALQLAICSDIALALEFALELC